MKMFGWLHFIPDEKKGEQMGCSDANAVEQFQLNVSALVVQSRKISYFSDSCEPNNCVSWYGRSAVTLSVKQSSPAGMGSLQKCWSLFQSLFFLQNALKEPHKNSSCSNSALLTLRLNLLQNEDAAVSSSSRLLDSQTFLDSGTSCWLFSCAGIWLLKTHTQVWRASKSILKFKNPDCDVMDKFQMNHRAETIDSAQVWPSFLILLLGVRNQNEDK